MPYTPDAYGRTLEAWAKNNRLVVRPRGHEIPVGINTADVSDILTEEAYQTYIYSNVKLKQYIQNGVWRDTKEHQEIRVEAWLQKQRDEQQSLQPPPEESELSEEKQARVRELMAEMRARFSRKKV